MRAVFRRVSLPARNVFQAEACRSHSRRVPARQPACQTSGVQLRANPGGQAPGKRFYALDLLGRNCHSSLCVSISFQRYNRAHEIPLSWSFDSLSYVCGGYDLHGASGEGAGGGAVR